MSRPERKKIRSGCGDDDDGLRRTGKQARDAPAHDTTRHDARQSGRRRGKRGKSNDGGDGCCDGHGQHSAFLLTSAAVSCRAPLASVAAARDQVPQFACSASRSPSSGRQVMKRGWKTGLPGFTGCGSGNCDFNSSPNCLFPKDSSGSRSPGLVPDLEGDRGDAVAGAAAGARTQ